MGKSATKYYTVAVLQLGVREFKGVPLNSLERKLLLVSRVKPEPLTITEGISLSAAAVGLGGGHWHVVVHEVPKLLRAALATTKISKSRRN